MATVGETFDVVLKAFKERFREHDPYFIAAVFVGLFVVIITTICLIFRGKSSGRRNVLLLGLSDSGKTTLFSKLIYDAVLPTQTSIKENVGLYNVSIEKKQSVSLIDVPGYERLRHKFFDQFKSTARGLIFVVDSFTFQKDLRDVAAFLYNVLTDATVVQNAMPLLIACNKHDQALAKGSQLIQSALEKELNNVRMTKSASLPSTEGGGGKSSVPFLGKRNQPFTFNDIKPIQVEFIECSARRGGGSGDEDLKQLKNWILRVA